MQSANGVLQGQLGPQVAPGEPSSATWIAGQIRITYEYDASLGLRMIDIQGPQARFLLNDLLNIEYRPTLEGYKVSGMLEPSNAPERLLAGIRAAEFIGVSGAQHYYINPIGALMRHSDARVAAEARRVRAVLTARA